uniref:Uncharacterized protein n=1 Tax=Cucumis melo TaxID=3656 RepID=A0A9I9DYV7_CUCME
MPPAMHPNQSRLRFPLGIRCRTGHQPTTSTRTISSRKNLYTSSPPAKRSFSLKHPVSSPT